MSNNRIDERAAARLLLERDNIVIFAHRKPDGDAIGSCFGLLFALLELGKKARVECADPLIAGKYEDIIGSYEPLAFEPEYFVAADVADEGLLLGVHKPYGGRIDLCVDHHGSNTFFAENTVLDSQAAAAAEIVYRVVLELGIIPGKNIANAIFLGLTTDTGGFRYPHTTASTHDVAAETLRWGADGALINRLVFFTKSKGRLAVEKFMLDTMEYRFGDRCVYVLLPADIHERFSVAEEELDGIAGFTNTIEGVLASVTVRQSHEGEYRVSLRSKDPVDSARICAAFGGGGHRNAGGCVMKGTDDEVREKILAEVEKQM
jgi:phosphoesterase RecJ-like protein